MLSFETVRNPWSKFIKYLLTSQIMNMFLLCAFALEHSKLANKLEVISVVLLAYINLINAARGDIPEI